MSAVAAKAKRTQTRAIRRAVASERKRTAKQQKAVAEEEKAERIAPKVQREPVLGRNGEVIRGPRLEPDGISFRRSNPVRRMRKMNERKEQPLVTKAHEDAADRLLSAWEESSTITSGVGSYGERIGGNASTGMIADATLDMMNWQMRARAEVEMVRTHLGALWPIVHAVVILGIDCSAWGEQCGLRPDVASGYLAASLDRLVQCFSPKDERRQRMRMAEFTGIRFEEISDSR